MSFTLTYPLRLCLFRVLLDTCPFCFLQYTALPTCCNCSLFYYLEFAWVGAHPPHSGGVCYTLAAVTNLPLSMHTGRWRHTHLLWPACLFTVHVKECPSLPPPGGASHTSATVTSFPLSKVDGQVPPFLPFPTSLFIYSLSGECPSPTLQSSGCPALFATCLFFSAACLLFNLFFSFFPGWGSVCPGGYADLAQGCL
jgi:hypothetical protein